MAASGAGSKDLTGKEISRELEDLITQRESRYVGTKEKGRIPLTNDQKEESYSQTIQPIICAGDAIGAVVLMGKSAGDMLGESEQKLVQTAAGFLGRQMEQ